MTNISELDAAQQAALGKECSLLLLGGSASTKTAVLSFRIKQALEYLAERRID